MKQIIKKKINRPKEIKVCLPAEENKNVKENEHYSIDNSSLFKYKFDKIIKRQIQLISLVLMKNMIVKLNMILKIKNLLYSIKVGHSYENKFHSYIINKYKKDIRWHN